jgi:hypothetical protein
VKVECGAPAFTIGTGDAAIDVTDAEVDIFYMEYTASEVNLDGEWPSKYKVDGSTF